MKKSKFKAILALVVALVLTSSVFFSVTYADGTKKVLEAWYGTTNIVYNNKDLTAELQPFAVNGTTYLPLRKMADLFNKDILWDQATRSVILADRPDAEIAALKTELALKDSEIAELQKKIMELEVMDIDELEDVLNDDFADYEDIEFSISLSGDEKDVAVEIEVDLDEYQNEWDDLSTTRIKSYLQDICDAILEEYKDANIEGTISDSSTSRSPELYSFSITSTGTVKLEASGSDLSDLQGELEDDLLSDFDDIDLSMELDGDEGELTYTVYVDLDEYESEYTDYLDNGDIEDLMVNIYYTINDTDGFEDCDITGFINDTATDDDIARCYKGSTGGVIFRDDL